MSGRDFRQSRQASNRLAWLDATVEQPTDLAAWRETHADIVQTSVYEMALPPGALL